MKQMTMINKLKVKNLIPYTVMLLSTLVLPFLAHSQPSPPGGGGTGGNPDDHPLGGVPFDWRLNILLVLAGVVFSIVVMRKIQKQKAVKAIA